MTPKTYMIGTLLAAAALAAPLRAEQPTGVDAALQTVAGGAKVKAALEAIKADDAAAFAEQKRITEIAAPPYKEKVRAEYYLKRMQELGFRDASIDAEGNVIDRRKGTGGGHPLLAVA